MSSNTNSNMPDYVKKREGVGFIVFALVFLATAIWAASIALPFAAAVWSVMQSTAAKAAVTAISVTILGAMFLNLSNLYLLMRILARKVTGIVVAIDPVSVMRETILDIKKRQADVDKQIQRVVAARTVFQRQVEKLEADKSEANAQLAALAKSDKASNPNYIRQAKSIGGRVTSIEAALTARKKQLADMQRLEACLLDAKEICALAIEKKESDVVLYNQNWEAAKAAQSAIKGARTVLGDIGNGEQQWDAARDFIDDGYANALADVDMLINDMSSDLVKRDINDMVAVQRVEDARKALEQAPPVELSHVRADSSTASTAEGDLDRLLRVEEAKRRS